ncbi:unknown [Bacteroides sp. CAG:875]|nr:unknown [Bacteroides sp. CAG:875]
MTNGASKKSLISVLGISFVSTKPFMSGVIFPAPQPKPL